MQKNLTIVAMDTAYHALTRRAVEQAIEVTGSENVVILSDQDILSGSKWIKIDPIDAVEYNRIVLKELVPYIDTEHFMIIQYDGIPVDKNQWSDDYLKYDYIGAVWPWGPANRCVGNGGFSVRSRRIMEACQGNQVEFIHQGDMYQEDVHICNIYRDYLENQGMIFAPAELARKFSAENPPGRFDTYGFHGTLCLPYYLNDDYMNFYIDNMNLHQYTSEIGSRIVFGLYNAQRWEHLERMVDRGCSLISDFKDRLVAQVARESNYFPNLTAQDIEQLMINY
jgi:hypothetical protein